MAAKYQFYEVVRICEHCQFKEIAGLRGAVLGIAQNSQGEWGYAVSIDKLDETWDLPESDLEPTGIMRTREEYYDESSIRVVVDPKTGEGKIANKSYWQWELL